MKKWMALALVAAAGVVVFSCSGSDPIPPQGTACVMNSDCKNPLSCSFGRCHVACQEARDCPLDQRCVTVPGGNVCQLPDNKQCLYNSDCKPAEAMLVCASDFQCRNQCVTSVDCTTSTQVCVAPGVCAEPDEIDPVTNTLKPGTPPMASVDAGMVGDAGMMTPVDGAVVPMGDGGMTMMSDVDAMDSPLPVEGVMVNRSVVRSGEINIIITVVGTNLDNPRDFDLGGLNASLRPGATATKFEVQVSVPHGLPVGPRDFTFRTDGGVGSAPDLVTVSAITASPTGADTNRGTSDDPFRSFSRAAMIASENDTIHLLNGTYSVTTSAENWGAQLPNGITIMGQGHDTKLVGPGEGGIHTNVDGLVFAGNATVKDLSVGFFRYNVLADKAGQELNFENVQLDGNRTNGIRVAAGGANSKITLTGNTDISRCAGDCIHIAGAGVSLSMTGGRIQIPTGLNGPNAISLQQDNAEVILDDVTVDAGTGNSSYALYMYRTNANAKVVIKNSELNRGIYFRDSNVATTNILEISDTTIETSQTQGIYFYGATLTLVDSMVTVTSSYGVQQAFGRATVRGTTIEGYTSYGYYITSGWLDMGTATEPGNNQFIHQMSGTRYGLYEGRGAGADPITVSNTTFNGDPVTPAQTVSGPATLNNFYRVAPGNSIIFSVI